MITKVGVTDAGCTVYRIGDRYWICPQYIYITFPDGRVMIRLRYFNGATCHSKAMSKVNPDVDWIMSVLSEYCNILEAEGMLRLLKTQRTLTVPILEAKRYNDKRRFVINIPKALKRDLGYVAHSETFDTVEKRIVEYKKMQTRRNILEAMIRNRFCVSATTALHLHESIPLARDSIEHK